MATFLYARVFTSEQTITHQKIQAEQAGFTFDHVIVDEGVSGMSVSMRERPQGRWLFDMLRSGDVLVVRSVGRLGRNYLDVTNTIREFIRRGVVIRTIINNMTFDGSIRDPMQMAVRDALISFMAASAQAQLEATKEAQKAGIANAKEKSADANKGRKPSYNREQMKWTYQPRAQASRRSPGRRACHDRRFTGSLKTRLPPRRLSRCGGSEPEGAICAFSCCRSSLMGSGNLKVQVPSVTEDIKRANGRLPLSLSF